MCYRGGRGVVPTDESTSIRNCGDVYDGNSPRPDDCKIPRAGYATWSCRCICDILMWQNHHVNGILCHVKWPWSIVNAIQARPTTETYDMAGKHWLNTISLMSGGAVRRNSLRCAPFGPPTVSCVLAPPNCPKSPRETEIPRTPLQGQKWILDSH